MNQLLVITHGEIGSANRARKEHIAYPGELGLAVQKHHMAGGVAGAMNHLEGLLTDGDRITVL